MVSAVVPGIDIHRVLPHCFRKKPYERGGGGHQKRLKQTFPGRGVLMEQNLQKTDTHIYNILFIYFLTFTKETTIKNKKKTVQLYETKILLSKRLNMKTL